MGDKSLSAECDFHNHIWVKLQYEYKYFKEERQQCTSIRKTQAVKGQVTCAILVTPGLVRRMDKQQHRKRERRFGKFIASRRCRQFCENTLALTHVPVEQLQGHSVAVVVGHQVHSLVAQAQVSHQGLHHTGLLENGVLVGSLGWSGTAENENDYIQVNVIVIVIDPKWNLTHWLVTEAKPQEVQRNDSMEALVEWLPDLYGKKAHKFSLFFSICVLVCY